MAIEFRFATLRDSGLLAELNRQLIQDEGHRSRMTVAELESRMRGWLAGDYRAVIGEVDGEVATYALFSEQPDEVYLRQLFVVGLRRRQGIGHLLIDFLRNS